MSEAIKKLVADYGKQNVIDDVMRYFNCHECDIDDAGDIWIAQPQTGHWLSAERVAEFVEWQANHS